MSLPDLQEPLRLLDQKKFDTAVEVLEEKVTALPAHLGAHVLLAYAHEAQAHWNRALASWEEVHLLMPNSPLAEEGKRRVLRRMEGIEGDGGRKAPVPSASEAGADDTEANAEGPADPADASATTPPPEEDSSDDALTDEESSDEDVPSGLAQLREQAEREARQGGARSGLAEESPDVEPKSSPEEPSPTPEEQVEELEDEEDADTLDHLINKLESARVDPEPDAERDAPPPDPDEPEDESEEVVSETLARIHEAQEDYETAAHIYEQLADQEPDRAEEFQQKADDLRAKANDSDEEA